MQLKDLLEMSMSDVIEWLEENADDYVLQPKPIEVDSPEDIEVDEEVLCWDGCDWVIDHVEYCPEQGVSYMANGTDVEAYVKLPDPL